MDCKSIAIKFSTLYCILSTSRYALFSSQSTYPVIPRVFVIQFCLSSFIFLFCNWISIEYLIGCFKKYSLRFAGRIFQSSMPSHKVVSPLFFEGLLQKPYNLWPYCRKACHYAIPYHFII